MFGPQPRGHWSKEKGPNCGSAHDILVSGSRYEVITEFRDFDGDVHCVGESWIFLGFCFLPYDEGMSFFITTDPEYEWLIPLQWRPEQQGPILDNIATYVRAAV
jgi:hypothetical protein